MLAIQNDLVKKATTVNVKVLTPEELREEHMRAGKVIVMLDGSVQAYGKSGEISRGKAYQLPSEAADAIGLNIRYVYVCGKITIVTYQTQNCSMDASQAKALIQRAFKPLFTSLDRQSKTYHFANGIVPESQIHLVTLRNWRSVDMLRELGLKQFCDLTLDEKLGAIFVAGRDQDNFPVSVRLNSTSSGSLAEKVIRISQQEKLPTYIAASGGLVAVLLQNQDGSTALMVKLPDANQFRVLQPESGITRIFVDDNAQIVGQTEGDVVTIDQKSGDMKVAFQKPADFHLPGITIGVNGEKLTTVADSAGCAWTFASYDVTPN